MKAFNKPSSGDYEKCPEGQHIAKLVGIIDMGTQEVAFQGDTKFVKKMYLQFEVFPEGEDGEVLTQKDGSSFLVGQDFTASMSPKGKLLPFINGWRGKPLEDADFPFDFSRMLGKYGLMTVVHNKSKDGSKTYANINGVTAVPKKLAQNSAGESILPKGEVTQFFFDLDAQDWGAMSEIFANRLWDGIRGKIMSSPEFQKRDGIAVEKAADDQEIPF